MKIAPLFCLFASTNAFTASFAPQSAVSRTTTSTELNLFGGKKEGGAAKGPGMMDQLAMLKKAQEIASKKAAIDKELAATEHSGSSADGKVNVVVKYIAPLPMQQPGYEPVSAKIDESWLADASTEDVNAALKEAVMEGLKKATAATAEKMQILTAELASVMGEMQGGASGGAPASPI
eukprot:CAMPEP_0196802644 /NCGR_PEP_ID=MMETSP1362-20130617/2221_1 /TAXON_ID=163516 /ORGANISM="Leptocylindrus danicus, Strain CCMP1856" /LENGTH=177 /DNA_ID=CAMNT_0042173989 /DNA_START=69 /DNA_END=602 /DNA_ORIENTATION=+